MSLRKLTIHRLPKYIVLAHCPPYLASCRGFSCKPRSDLWLGQTIAEPIEVLLGFLEGLEVCLSGMLSLGDGVYIYIWLTKLLFSSAASSFGLAFRKHV